MDREFRVARPAADISDDALCWAVVAKIWPYDEAEDNLERIAEGTPGQRAVYATLLFAQEVDNGGLKQFFRNSSSMYYQEALDGFGLLGAFDVQQTLQTALNFLPGAAPSPDWEVRRSAVAALTPEQQLFLRRREDEVYARGGFAAVLTPLWVRYIRDHPAEFFLDAAPDSQPTP